MYVSIENFFREINFKKFLQNYVYTFIFLIVCQEDLHTSKEPCQIPPCHHLIHKTCFDQLIQNCHFYCPTCSKSLLNLQPLWEAMKVQIDQFPMQGKMKV